MFHFGLPSEKLNQDICPQSKTPKKQRYNKLLYIGSGTDPLPLPVAKSAVFVDRLNSKIHIKCDNFGVEKCDEPKCVIGFLLEKVKSLYVILQKPVVTWYTISKRPVAKVVFEWGEMPFLTQHGDKTVLSYIFGTDDAEIGTNQYLKSFSMQVDIIWLCGYGPSLTSFKHINLKNIDLAVGCNHLYLPKALKHCANYYYIEHLKLSDMFLRQSYKMGFLPHWPKCFNFQDLCFLLGCTISSKAQSYLDLQRECDLFNNSNNPFKYLKFCSVDEMYKVSTDPTLVPYKCCDLDDDDCPWLEVISDSHGWTNIHMAAEQGDLGMVKVLVTKALAPNAPDDLGNTPISLAKHYSHVDVVKFLEDFCKSNLPTPQEASQKG